MAKCIHTSRSYGVIVPIFLVLVSAYYGDRNGRGHRDGRRKRRRIAFRRKVRHLRKIYAKGYRVR